jgi:hypothetical protein
MLTVGSDLVRGVTHLDVSREDTIAAAQVLTETCAGVQQAIV